MTDNIARYISLYNRWIAGEEIRPLDIMLLACDLRWDLEEAQGRIYELEETIAGRG